jgi:stage V sporulation protein R
MELIDQHTKTIMEGLQGARPDGRAAFRGREPGVYRHQPGPDRALPKMMIPDPVRLLGSRCGGAQGKGQVRTLPRQPLRNGDQHPPGDLFYNDNNPDWLNVMIFYHVLAHIDFFQNNLYFRHTWDYDFNGQALSDKRTIARLRTEKGRWVDYVIEFTRGIDNLVGYHGLLSAIFSVPDADISEKVNFYFDVFCRKSQKSILANTSRRWSEYNACIQEDPLLGEQTFFARIDRRRPEFGNLFKKPASGNKKKEAPGSAGIHHGPFQETSPRGKPVDVDGDADRP